MQATEQEAPALLHLLLSVGQTQKTESQAEWRERYRDGVQSDEETEREPGTCNNMSLSAGGIKDRRFGAWKRTLPEQMS